MRLMKMFGLAALAAVAAMAFVGATSASANFDTQLCNVHTALTCSSPTASVHATLAAGKVGTLLSPLTVLCLGVLVEASALALGKGKPQEVHTTKMEFTGCGTSSTHNNCEVKVEKLPLNSLLKLGLDSGTLEALSGEVRLICSGGINCVYDLEGSLFSAGANHLTANETPTIELGGKFFCPNEGFLDGLLKNLTNSYILS